MKTKTVIALATITIGLCACTDAPMKNGAIAGGETNGDDPQDFVNQVQPVKPKPIPPPAPPPTTIGE